MSEFTRKNTLTLCAQFNAFFNAQRLVSIIWMLLGGILAWFLY